MIIHKKTHMTRGVPVCASCWTLVGDGALYICRVGGALFVSKLGAGVTRVSRKSETRLERTLPGNGAFSFFSCRSLKEYLYLDIQP